MDLSGYSTATVLPFSAIMTTETTDFDSLLQAARREPEPQRLLFVFLQPVLPEEHTEEEARRFQQGEGGALEPVVCVDKGLDELTTFEDLVAESERTGTAWQIMLIASLAGKNGDDPSEKEVEDALQMMLKTVGTGGSLSKFVAFRRDGTLLHFG